MISTLKSTLALTADPALFLVISSPTSHHAVGAGVGLQEIIHNFVAQRYGLWAEFRYNLRGLLLAFVFAFFGFIFGAPGATWISGTVTSEQNGRISAARRLKHPLVGGAAFSSLRIPGPTPPSPLASVLL